MGFASVFFIQTYQLPEVSSLQTSAAFMPRMYSVLLFICGLLLLLQSFRKSGNIKVENKKLLSLLVLLLLLYIILMPIIGFYVVTPVFLFIALWFLKVRGKWSLILVPSIATLSVFLFFQYLLKVPIPLGLFA